MDHFSSRGAAALAAMLARRTQSTPGQVLRERTPTSDEQKVLASRNAKPGRNEQCPCGSGVKYKKCCLKKLKAMEQEQRDRQRRRPAERLPRERPMPSAIVIEEATSAPADKNATAMAMINADVDRRIVWAYLETGLYITDINKHAHPQENLDKWEAALQQYDDATEDERRILLAPATADD